METGDVLNELQEEMLPAEEGCSVAKEEENEAIKIPLEAKETLQKQHCEMEDLCSKLEGVVTTEVPNRSVDQVSDYLDYLVEGTIYNNNQSVLYKNLNMELKDTLKKLSGKFKDKEKDYAVKCRSIDLHVEQMRSNVCSLKRERDELQKRAERATQLKSRVAELTREKIELDEKFKEECEKIQTKRHKKEKEVITKKKKNEDHLRVLGNQIGTVKGKLHRIRKDISELKR